MGLADAVGLGQQRQPRGGDHAAGHHQGGVGQGRHHPGAGEEGEAGRRVGVEAAGAEDGGHHHRPAKEHRVTPERQRRGGFGAAKAARGDHRDGVGHARHHRQQRGPVEQARPGAHHDDDADKAGQHADPAAKARTFVQGERREEGDEQRRREVERDRRGHRQPCEAEVIGGIGDEHDHAAPQHPAQAGGDKGAEPAVAVHEDQQQGRGDEGAQRHRLGQRVAAAEQLQDHVLAREDGDADAQKQDAARVGAGRGRGGGGHAGGLRRCLLRP